jgi:hypothetical protein
METLTYLFNFDQQLGSSDEDILATITYGEDFDGDGFNDIKISLNIASSSNSGTEDLIGVAFDLGNDSLINSLDLTVNNINTYTSNGTLSTYDPTYVIGAEQVSDDRGYLDPGFTIAGSSLVEPYDVGIKFSDQGSGEGIVQSASFVISGNQDLTYEDLKAIIDQSKWYLRLQSTDGGQESAKTGGLVLMPEVSIDKVTNGADGLTILEGSDVTWTYTVTNTGSVGLSGVNVTDDQGELPVYFSGDNGNGILDVGETWLYTATGKAIAGDYANIGSVTGTDGLNVVGDQDASNYFGADPNIAINKVTNGADGLNILAGSEVTWTYTVSNTGNVGLSNVSLSDDQGEVPIYLSGDVDSDNILDLNETWVYQAQGTAVIGDYVNLGTVTGSFTDDLQNTEIVSAEDYSSYFGANPGIFIDKVTNGADGLTILEGSEVTWTYTVSNTGNVGLSGVNLTDDQGEVPVYLSGDADSDNILDTSEVWVYSAKGTAILGDYANIGTVTGSYTDDLGNTTQVMAEDASNYTGIKPEEPPVVEEDGLGKTPGFWKQTQHFEYWAEPYDTTDKFSETFGVNSSSVSGWFNDSLLGALSAEDLKGKTAKTMVSQYGNISSLGRAATAGLLNASADELIAGGQMESVKGDDINYNIDQSALLAVVGGDIIKLTAIVDTLKLVDLNGDTKIGSSEVISAVQDAFDSTNAINNYFVGATGINALAGALDAMNNMAGG